MELGLWNTLWANSAFCTTFLALPTHPLLGTDQNIQIVDDNLRHHDHETQTIEYSSSDSEDSDNESSDKETEIDTSVKDNSPDIQNSCSNSDSNSLQSNHTENNNILVKNTQDDVKLCLNAKRKKSYQRIRYSREEYRCTMCPYTCTTERAFLKHLRSHSNETDSAKDQTPDSVPRLSCPVCGKDRTGEPALNRHMLKHRDNRHFCCDICSFKTVQLKKLIQHRRMHTGERPHLCPHCVYRAARRDNLRSHVRRVHKKDNLNCDTFSPRGMLLIPSSKTSKIEQKND